MEDGSLQLSYTSAPYSVEQVRLGKLRIVQHSTNTETEYKGGCSCFSWVARKEQIIKGKSLVIHMSSFISCYYRQKVLFHQCSRNKSSLFSRTSHFLLRIGKKKLSRSWDLLRVAEPSSWWWICSRVLNEIQWIAHSLPRLSFFGWLRPRWSCRAASWLKRVKIVFLQA